MISIFQQLHRMRSRGFVLPLTLIVCIIILTIATGISIILTKELYFSKLSRLSQVAYYAADNALMCATMVDDYYIDPDTGLGIFEYSTEVTPEEVLAKIDATLTLLDIKCATSAIFDPVDSEYSTTVFTRIDEAGNPDTGRTTTFSMRMDLGNGEFRCAKVEINKTSAYRQIISRGFASCSTNTASYPVERAIVSTSALSDTVTDENDGIGQAEYVVPGSYTWTAPEGVTRVSVLAIGGGGAGGAAIGGGGGGGGGGLGFKNNIRVTPGNTYTVVVGAGGVGVAAINGGDGGDGGDSYFKDTSTVRGQGGQGGDGSSSTSKSGDRNGGNGGTSTGDDGGVGGDGADSESTDSAGGGGGAGGYMGNGGDGGNDTGQDGDTNSGAGAGGSESSNTSAALSAQSGGGVGVLGIGATGDDPGEGGSGGSNGSANNTNCSVGIGGTYGGGGAGQSDDTRSMPGCNGGGGAVRIIWPGDLRQFPSTRTANE